MFIVLLSTRTSPKFLLKNNHLYSNLFLVGTNSKHITCFFVLFFNIHGTKGIKPLTS